MDVGSLIKIQDIQELLFSHCRFSLLVGILLLSSFWADNFGSKFGDMNVAIFMMAEV
jgi:hypothetical protein